MSADNEFSCPICDRESSIMHEGGTQTYRWDCLICGHLCCDDTVYKQLRKRSPEQKVMLAAYACERHLLKVPLLTLARVLADGDAWRGHDHVRTVDNILERMRLVFDSVAERSNRTLRNLSRKWLST